MRELRITNQDKEMADVRCACSPPLARVTPLLRKAGQRVSSCFPFGVPSPPPLPNPLLPLHFLAGLVIGVFPSQFGLPFGFALPGAALAEATAPRTTALEMTAAIAAVFTIK